MLVGARAGRPCLRCQAKVLNGSQTLSSVQSRPIRTHPRKIQEQLGWQRRRHIQSRRSQGTYTGAQKHEEDSHLINEHSQLHAEANARQARIRYGDSLPANLLSEEEYKIYERLFGPPASLLSAEETLLFEEGGSTVELEIDEPQRDELLARDETPKGLQDEVALEEEEEEEYEEEEDLEDEEEVERLLERQKAEEEYYQMEQTSEASLPRSHPLTVEGRFNTSPAIFELPNDSMVIPTTKALGKLSNKHLAEAAERTFGGRFMPDSVATPRKPHLQQRPPQLTATQSSMSSIEAGLFISANMPGMYACASSALVETRKRLGSAWLDRLFDRTGGPRVLDVGSAGAAVQAWREVLRVEWERLHPKAAASKEYPQGKSTVVVGPHELRDRIYHLSSDTTFLPRLPDFERQRDLPGWNNFEPGARKHYDIIIASHMLWTFSEEYERRDLIQNLWSLLDPKGGILIIIEKGVPRGFELVGGARELLLNHHIASPESDLAEELPDGSRENRHTQKETGMIVAPCTNHGRCPMYKIPGEMQGRKEYCHFSTRFVRPPYLKRLVGSKARDHERIRFSYVSVQRGVDLRQTQAVPQNEAATQAALAGFEHIRPKPTQTAELTLDEDTPLSQTTTIISDPLPASPSMLSLPRLILPPLKRHGHVTFDVCTPSATIERWTLPKSRSKQGYRDARKAKWGDLWALGAKTRVSRTPRTGVPKAKLTTARRVPNPDTEKEGEFDVVTEEQDALGAWVDVPGAEPGKGTSRKASGSNKKNGGKGGKGRQKQKERA